MTKRLIAAFWAALLAVCTAAAQPVPELKKAILMTYYGTLDDSARVASYDALTHRVAQAFAGREVRVAYTSRSTATAMTRHDGQPHPLVEQALRQLAADGYNSVVVVSTELIEGRTERLMQRRLAQLAPLFFEVKATTPLLFTADDCRQVLGILCSHIGPQADEQAVLVAHGKNGAYDDVFCLADYILQHEGHPNCHIGTAEGYPSLDNIRQLLLQSGQKKVVLAPLMITGGGHAKRVVAGRWRQALEAEGYEVRLARAGVLDYADVQQLIVEKIKEADQKP